MDNSVCVCVCVCVVGGEESGWGDKNVFTTVGLRLLCYSHTDTHMYIHTDTANTINK